MAATVGLLEAGVDRAEVRHRFLDAVSRHHLSYGHGIIYYTQKTFEVLDRIGWDRASSILPHLAARLVNSTREDTLPYLRRAAAEVAGVDLDRLAAAPQRSATGWWDAGLIDTLLSAPQAPIGPAVRAVEDGAGIEGLLDAVTLAVSLRLLDHDPRRELDADHTFGWLDITRGLTTARAARWAWRADPGPHTAHTARQALWAVWLCSDTGRCERRHGAPAVRGAGFDETVDQLSEAGSTRSAAGDPGAGCPEVDGSGVAGPGPVGGDRSDRLDLTSALAEGRPDDVVMAALAGDPESVAADLATASLQNRAGSFIVVAHLVKTALAAAEEAEATGSSLPQAAAARFLAAPRLERFMARSVAEAIGVVRTGRPPRR